MTKKEAIAREVAKLLKKYKPEELKDAISFLAARKTRQSPKDLKQSKKPAVKKAKKQLRNGRASLIVKQDSTAPKRRKAGALSLEKKRARPTRGAETRRGFIRSSPNEKDRTRVMKRKDEVRSRPIKEQGTFTPQSLRSAFNAIKDDRVDDYARWFRIISGEAEPEKAAHDTKRTADHKSEAKPLYTWTFSIENLALRDLLVGSAFRLQGAPREASRIITFLPDGSIGRGRTEDEFGWRLREGTLEVLDEEGSVRSRFLFSKDGEFVRETKGASDDSQRLIRVTSKTLPRI